MNPAPKIALTRFGAGVYSFWVESEFALASQTCKMDAQRGRES